MNLDQQLDHYLSVRRALGFDLRTCERILRRFTRFAVAEGATHVDTALFLRWHATLAEAQTSTRGQRLSAVRLFSQWLSGFDPAHEVLPRRLLRSAIARSRPYIYSDTEIAAIIAALEAAPRFDGIRGLTHSTLFGLIAVTGLRISEALALDHDDLDVDHAVLRVRNGKLGKERLLPLDPSVVAKLVDFRVKRDRLIGRSVTPLFVTRKGKRISMGVAQYNFARTCQKIGLRTTQPGFMSGKGPRIHDLRHSFAVKTMINWYRTGKDPAREMIRLTTYLGHAEPANTYWYLEAVPELLELAVARATAERGEVIQ